MKERQESESSRKSKWYRQRKKWGFDDRDTWNLDHTIAEFTLPRLRRFREVTNGYPGKLTFKEWDEILGKIIYSMEAISEEWEESEDVDKSKKMQEGLDLFGKYFRHLWW